MPKTYEGNCHCGLVRFTVTLDDPLWPDGEESLGDCNCSICTKNGYLLVYPRREDVKFANESDAKLKDYFFGRKNKAHRFCPECGSSVLIDFKNSHVVERRGLLAVNARLFKDIDLTKVKFDPFDGMKELDPPYTIEDRTDS